VNSTRSPRPWVTVEFVGLLPTIYSTCAPCCEADYVGACSPAAKTDQMNDYPPEVRAAQDRMVELVERLHAEFGPRVRLISVGTTSLRGLWLSLRHRLDSSLHLVVNGRHVLSAMRAYIDIAHEIQEELAGEPNSTELRTGAQTNHGS
jgi:hypothetical protein